MEGRRRRRWRRRQGRPLVFRPPLPPRPPLPSASHEPVSTAAAKLPATAADEVRGLGCRHPPSSTLFLAIGIITAPAHFNRRIWIRQKLRVSDARCRAVARAAPPLASLRQAVACSSREERPRCPHPNALTFRLASYTPRRGGQGIDIDTSYLWGYSVVGGWAGACGVGVGCARAQRHRHRHSTPHTAQAREERLVYALGGCSA